MHHESFVSQIRPIFTISSFEFIVGLIILIGLTFSILIGALDMTVFLQQSISNLASSSSIYEQYGAVAEHVNSDPTVANAFIFILWAIIGLLLFHMFLFVRYSERSTVELFRLFKKGGSSAREAFDEKAVQITIRILALILLFLLTSLVISMVLPLIILLLDLSKLQTVGDYILSIIAVWTVSAIVGHAIIVLLRCITLRRRLLFN